MATPSRALLAVLISGMLLTGVSNTLLTKLQDRVCIRDCDNPDPTRRDYFEQPVIQTFQMFVGECGCWLVVGILALQKKWHEHRSTPAGYTALPRDEDAGDDQASDADPAENPLVKSLTLSAHGGEKLQGWKLLYLSIPAICDICGTTLMNVGLLFVAASIYQMTRGALVLFVGLFSVLFLKRHLFLYQWFALVTVVLGVGVVGLAGALFHESKDAFTDPSSLLSTMDATSTVLQTVIGIFLIAFAQVFTATQFVVEEWILERYLLEPIKVVGWEGIFGLSFTSLGMVVLHFLIGRTEKGRNGYFDLVEGWREIRDYPMILQTSILIMISIGAFNFFGLSVTRSVSATSRSTIDTCRTLFIWIVSLLIGWESFKWLQVIGFGLLVYGTFLFNKLVRPPLRQWIKWKEDTVEEEELLPENPIEHN